MNPPHKAIGLWVEEKLPIQAVDRTQPGLPRKRGRCRTSTPDSVRPGTTNLWAALKGLDGTVMGGWLARPRREEFLRFLRWIDRQTPPGVDLPLMVDHDGTHQQARVGPWLQAHRRFQLPFTPTGSCWLNVGQRRFAELTRKRIGRGVLRSGEDWKTAMELYLQTHHQNPRPVRLDQEG